VDRISALRNVEEALRAFEAGEAELETTQRRVQSVRQSYATEYADPERHAYRAHGDPPADGTVVVAPDPGTAKSRVSELTETDAGSFEIERL